MPRFSGIPVDDDLAKPNRFGGIPVDDDLVKPNRFGGIPVEQEEPEDSLWASFKTNLKAGIDEFGARQDFKQIMHHLKTINKVEPAGRAPLYVSPTKYSEEAVNYAHVELQKNLKSLNKNLKQVEQAPMSENSQRMMRAESFSEAWDLFNRDPITAIVEIGARSLPASTVSMLSGALGALGGPAGFATGLGISSGLNEYDASIMQALQEEDINIGDLESIKAATNNIDLMNKVKQRASVKSAIIGTVDALSGGLAAKTLVPEVIKSVAARQLINVPAQTLAQAALGGAGEALGEFAATGEIRPGEIVAEAIGETFTAPVEVLVATTARRKTIMEDVIDAKDDIAASTSVDEALGKADNEIAASLREEIIREPEPAPVLEPEPAPVLKPEPAPALEPEVAPALKPELIPEPVNEFARENARIRGEDKTIWNKAVKVLADQLRPGGLMPRKAYKLSRQLSAKDRLASFDIENMVADLEDAVKGDFGVKITEMRPESLNNLSSSLKGAISDTLPEKTKTSILAMRQYIDSFSEKYATFLQNQVSHLVNQAEETGNAQLMEEAGLKADLMSKILGNVGNYVNRSYAIFDDPDHAKNITDDVLNDARGYLATEHINRGESPDNARVLAEQNVREILDAGAEHSDLVSFFSSPRLGAKNLNILVKRKDIAPEIRALMGEYVDPRINFITTATKLSRLVHTQDFLNSVREAGMDDFLFEDNVKRPPEASIKIAADKAEIYSPLNGLYTTPEVAKTFKETFATKNVDGWLNTLLTVNAAVKLGATVLSPSTSSVNFLSNALIMVANGDTDFTKTMISVRNLSNYMKRGGDKVKKEYVRELISLGVIQDSANATETLRLLDETKLHEIIPEGTKEITGRGWHNVKMFYQLGDDFWKIAAYENKRDQLREYTDLNEEEIKVKAGELVQERYPTYSMTGKLVQSLRRFPVTAPFLPWSSEIIRINYKILESIEQDIKDPKMRTLGLKRLIGYGAASTLTYGMAAVSRGLIDVSDEEDKAAKTLMPEWDQNANIVYTGRDKDGNLTYRNGSRMDPFAYFKEAVNAVARGENWKEKFFRSSSVLLGPVISRELGLGAIQDVIANKKPRTGAPIYKETDDVSNIAADSLSYIWKQVQPGFVKTGISISKAATGFKSATGREKDVAGEIGAAFGQRLSTIYPKDSIYYRAYDFKQGLSDASTTLNRALRDPNVVTEDDILNAFKHSLELRQKAFEKMSKVVDAGEILGLEPRDIRRVLRFQGTSSRDINGLISGTIPEWRPSNSSQKRAIEKARLFFGTDHIQELKARYSILRKISREQ